MSRDWADWTNYGIAAFCAGLGSFGLGFMPGLEPLRWALGVMGVVFFALSFVFFGLALQRSFVVRKWQQWKGKRRDEVQSAVELTRRQRELEPHLVAFDLFYPVAVSVLSLFYKLRSSGGSEEEWQALQEAAERAVSRADRLVQEGHRYYAFHSLAPFFAPLDRSRIGSYLEASRTLATCLYELDRHYSGQRQRAGLPQPRNWPMLPSADPPPSKASEPSPQPGGVL